MMSSSTHLNILSTDEILPLSMTPATAVLPKVDEQIGPTCASHAVGKAIQKIMHKRKVETDQAKIVISLQALFHDGTTTSRNPDAFNDKEITVKEKDGTRKFKVKVIINRTLWPKLESFSKNQDFSLPVRQSFFKDDKEYQEYKSNIKKRGGQVEMVLRWSLQMAWTSMGVQSIASTHAIYAESYKPATNVFSCVNSWGEGDKEHPRPRIHESRIYAIDFVQCTMKDETLNTLSPPKTVSLSKSV